MIIGFMIGTHNGFRIRSIAKKSEGVTAAGRTENIPPSDPGGLNMTHEQLNSFRCSLEELLAETTANVDRINGSIRDVFPSCADANDRATLEAERRMLILQAERERRLKREIQLAFHRINHGGYGICEACGEFIDVRRLAVQPTARMCVHCMREIERAMEADWAGAGAWSGAVRE
jgi:DnaK suppressor protein